MFLPVNTLSRDPTDFRVYEEDYDFHLDWMKVVILFIYSKTVTESLRPLRFADDEQLPSETDVARFNL